MLSIIALAGCGGTGGGDGEENPDVRVATNLWWEDDLAQGGASAPIEVLTGPLVVGQLTKVRVRFLSDGEANPTEIGLRLLQLPLEDQAEELVGECSMGDFALDPPAGPGENVYEIETVVPADAINWGYYECKLVGILDPRNRIAETVEIPEGEPADASGQGDNSLAVDVEISKEIRIDLDLEDLKFAPETLVFDAGDIPAIALDRAETFATFFGEDLNGTATRLSGLPRSGVARAAFLAALGDPRVEDFDTGFSKDQTIGSTKVPVSFAPGWGGGTTVSGSIEAGPFVYARKVAAPQTIQGKYPTSGEYFLEVHSAIPDVATRITIDLPADTPQRALGFDVTGLGNVAGSAMGVVLGKRLQGGGFTSVGGGTIPLPPLGDVARRSGAALFFGIAFIDAASTSFDHIEIAIIGGPDLDSCGVDGIILASEVRLDPSCVCSLDRDSMLAADIGISVPSIIDFDDMPLEVDFRIRDHEYLTDALRSAGKLPVQLSADVSGAGDPIDVPSEEGGLSEQVHDPRKRIDCHLETCLPSALVQAAAGLIDPSAEPGTAVDLPVDVTFRTFNDPNHGFHGTEKTSAITIRIVVPPPPKGVEWNYCKSFGNDTIGGEIDFRSGIFADGKGASGCAAGEFDLRLFGHRVESIVDACARASCDVSTDPSTAGLALQFRILSMGLEGGELVTRHQVIYEKRGEVEFQDGSTPPEVTLDLQPYGIDPSLFDLEAGKFGLDLADAGSEDDGIVLGNKSWGKCKTWVVYVIPMGAELEIGGKVGVRTHFQATRGDGRQHELSLLAGPYIRFYGGVSVFLGACADELIESLDRAPDEVVHAVEDTVACGKVAGASIDLTFLDFMVGPKGTAVLTPKTQDGVDGIDVNVGISVGAELTVLKGSFSLWVHYMEPHLCWTNILGRRIPYVCNPWIDCKTAGITIASFPGFTFETATRDLENAEFFVPFGVGSLCETCPRR